jgi:hypothetical protein
MSRKSLKKLRRNIKKEKPRNTKRRRKNIRKGKRGGTEETKVNCCMCEKKVNMNDTLIPRECLNKYGQRAHRICSECWWNPDTGFAREGIKHSCPGCVKNLPLTKTIPSKKSDAHVQIIDLTLDDE